MIVRALSGHIVIKILKSSLVFSASGQTTPFWQHTGDYQGFFATVEAALSRRQDVNLSLTNLIIPDVGWHNVFLRNTPSDSDRGSLVFRIGSRPQ